MATDPVMKIVPPYTPELLSSVQEKIVGYIMGICKSKLPPIHPMVLEFGSGWSTIWFAQMGCNVTSFEHNIYWWHEVCRVLTDNKLPSLGHVLYADPPHMMSRIADLIVYKQDLVLVDCIDEQRLPCLEASIPLLKSGGWLVLDDSHWDILQPAFSILKDWHNTTLDGMHTRKTGEVCYHRTTIFQKP